MVGEEGGAFYSREVNISNISTIGGPEEIQ